MAVAIWPATKRWFKDNGLGMGGCSVCTETIYPHLSNGVELYLFCPSLSCSWDRFWHRSSDFCSDSFLYNDRLLSSYRPSNPERGRRMREGLLKLPPPADDLRAALARTENKGQPFLFQGVF